MDSMKAQVNLTAFRWALTSPDEAFQVQTKPSSPDEPKCGAGAFQVKLVSGENFGNRYIFFNF